MNGIEQKAGGSICKSTGRFSEGLRSLHPEGGMGLACLKEQVFFSNSHYLPRQGVQASLWCHSVFGLEYRFLLQDFLDSEGKFEQHTTSSVSVSAELRQWPLRNDSHTGPVQCHCPWSGKSLLPE